MDNHPLASAIIIFLNEKLYLEEAITSVFGQSYAHWELLLVDDGSTDGSSQIARDWAQKFPEKVTYLEHEGHRNLGMSASRNLGIRSAKGKYISFLDGDDVWLPSKLEEQVAILEKYPQAEMVYAPLKLWYSWNGNPQEADADHLFGVRSDGHYPFRNQLVEPPLLLSAFLRYEQYLPGGFMVRRKKMLSDFAYEEDFRGPYSDSVALVKLCLVSTVYAASNVWYLYRKHEASNTYISWLEGTEREEQRIYLEWVETYLNKQCVIDPDLRNALNYMLLSHRHPIWFFLRRRLIRLVRSLNPTAFHYLRRLRKTSVSSLATLV